MFNIVTYNKLVRDRIPDIIRRQGETPQVKILDAPEYRQALECKLEEEVAEYRQSKELEELADILEVVYAICKAGGHSVEALQQLQEEKKQQRGGFDEHILLVSKEASS